MEMSEPCHHIAHLNIARLRALPGDPRVAEFVNAVPAVNAIAERSPGFVWRWEDNSTRVSEDVPFQAVLGDPLLAVSLSVWERATDLSAFVHKTLHGAFLRRRSVADGQARMAHLAQHGPTAHAFDFATHATFAA
jgi:hypothetical protein